MKNLLFVFILVLLSSFLNSTIINVPIDQPTIQAGIDASTNTDTVLVQPGTYVENINYNGKLITIGSLYLTTQDTTYISTTIIDGNESGSVVTFNSDEDSTAVLCGFTITNGLVFSLESFGGGIYCYESSPTLTSLIISDNSALDSGGGIYCYKSSPTLSSLEVSGNTTVLGGGIYNDESNPSLENVTIFGNYAASSGGGIYSGENSSISLINVTISGNFADDHHGGGIWSSNSSLSLHDVTITSNTADDYGGGIYCYNSSPILGNVTMSDNSALIGEGVYFDDSNIIIINSILWNNIHYVSSTITATYSDISGGFTGTGNIDSDPLFVDPGNGDYHLQSISPCIDAGDPSSPLDPDGSTTDMGAYYLHQYDIPPTAEYVSDTTQGYSPLTVNFNDLSYHGSFPICDWYWNFGDGNNSILQNPVNEYLLPGNYTISLTVTDENDSTDTKMKVDYITVYSTDPPAPPLDVLVEVVHPDAIITWTAVDTTLSGDPCDTAGYVIRYNETGFTGEEYYYFLAFTSETSYTHEFVSQYSTQMFYQVIAVVNLSREEIQYLKGLNGSHHNIRWIDVKKRLRKGVFLD